MRPSELEGWILQIADAVKAGRPVEDSRVELKSEWLDVAKMARQIGAHANAAHGEPTLWIIGLNEEKGVVGTEKRELSDWASEFEKEFDGMAPRLEHALNVPCEGGTLVGLLFETNRAPYVVRNPDHGKSGNIEFEVPYRRGNSTRSARREDLLRILLPAQRTPTIEVLPTSWVGGRVRNNHLVKLDWHVYLDLYVVPRSQDFVTIPFHKCSVAVRVEKTEISLGRIQFITSKDTAAISVSLHDVTLASSGMLKLSAHGEMMEQPGTPPKTIEVNVRIGYATTEQTSDFTVQLQLPGDRLSWGNEREFNWRHSQTYPTLATVDVQSK